MKCEACGHEMLDKVGCDVTWVLHESGRYDRIRYGDEPDDWGAKDGHPCHDCLVPPGAFHHPGCDAERCPRCGRQLISCDCADDLVWGDELRPRQGPRPT